MTDKPEHAFKVGDEVFIDDNRYGSQRPMTLAKVEKATRTQFTAGGVRFRPAGNDFATEVGSGHWLGGRVCRPATQEARDAQKFLISQAEARVGLRKVSELLCRMTGKEAIEAWASLPKSIRDLTVSK